MADDIYLVTAADLDGHRTGGIRFCSDIQRTRRCRMGSRWTHDRHIICRCIAIILCAVLCKGQTVPLRAAAVFCRTFDAHGCACRHHGLCAVAGACTCTQVQVVCRNHTPDCHNRP